MLNIETINRLVEIYSSKGDVDSLDFLCEELETFEEYHSAIYSMEIKLKITSGKNIDREEYQYYGLEYQNE